MQVKTLKIVESPLELDQKTNSNCWLISKNAVYFYGCVYPASLSIVKNAIVVVFNTLVFGNYSSSFVCVASKSFENDQAQSLYLSHLDDKISCDDCVECRKNGGCLAVCSCDCCSINDQSNQAQLYSAGGLRLTPNMSKVVDDNGFFPSFAWVYNQGIFYKNDYLVHDNKALASMIIEQIQCGIVLFYDDEKMRYAIINLENVDKIRSIFNQSCLDKLLDVKVIDIEKAIKSQ